MDTVRLFFYEIVQKYNNIVFQDTSALVKVKQIWQIKYKRTLLNKWNIENKLVT